MTMIKKICAVAALSFTSLTAFAQGTLLIKVHYSGSNYTVESVKHIDEVFPPFKRINPRADDLIFRLSNSEDVVMGEGRIDNPAVIRGVLVGDEDASSEGHMSFIDDSDGYFLLRYPYEQGMQFLQLMNAEDSLQAKSVRAAPGSSSSSNKIDLTTFLLKE